MNIALLRKFILLSLVCLFMSGCNKIADKSMLANEETKTDEGAVPEEDDVVVTTELDSNFDKQEDTEIPWGFDEKSYSLYKSGVLSEFIPNGSDVDQCIIADLDVDGIMDVILSISIPESIDPDDIHSYKLNTLILKGLGDGSYKLVQENKNANYFSSYDCSADITAGNGWFKFTRSRGTAGGYEYDYLFKYNKAKSDWFCTEYYYNNYGYVEYGVSSIQTYKNFGEISFDDFDEDNGISTEIADDPKSISVDTDGFVVDVSSCYVTLQDKVKEQKVNQLIADDLEYFIDNLRMLNVNVDINLFGKVTFETPEVISIEYEVFGTIDGDELNYSGVNRKYFTTIIDINNVKRITLADIIDINKFNQIIKEYGFSDVWLYDTKLTKANYNKLSEDERLKLLKSSDCLNAVFTENIGIFCALHEKSICLYFQPEFFGMGPESEEPKLYIPIENILPNVKVPYWNTPSEAATHIVWEG